MPKKKTDPLVKNHVVTIVHGSSVAQYMFFNKTKRQVMKIIADKPMIGEALTSLTFSEPQEDDSGTLFIGARNQEVESGDDD